MTLAFRTGIGYDVHRMGEGKPCILGGVRFDHTSGPIGHSDADVVLHAISDALLGACALGDIGQHFPDTDPRWKGADSSQLLSHCYALACDKGYILGNLDTIIVCERPKIGPQREAIRDHLARLFGVDKEVISVKATTEEKMGFTGSGEGIAAWANILLVKKS